MENNNRSQQSQPEPTVDWRTQLEPDFRKNTVTNMWDTLKKTLPTSGADDLRELAKIAARLEEKFYHSATSKSDYMQNIRVKMSSMMTRFVNSSAAKSLLANSAGGIQNRPDPASIVSTVPSANTVAVDWREEVYQKIKAWKETYFTELTDLYHKICFKYQHYSRQQQSQEQLEKIKILRVKVEHVMAFLQLSKNNVTPDLREKLTSYEKNIIGFLQMHGPKKFPSEQGQQQQLPHPLSMQNKPQETQVPQQVHSQMNPQRQTMNLQTVISMQSTSGASMPHGSLSSLPVRLRLPTAQTNNMNTLKPGCALESGQGNTSRLLERDGVTMQENTVIAPQQANVNTSQNIVNGSQPNSNSVQLNSNTLQNQRLKQQEEQRILPSQQMKQQSHQRQMHSQDQLLQQQKEKIIQQQRSPPLQQQQPVQKQENQLPQPHQMNKDLKKPGMGLKPGRIQPHSAGQSSAFCQQPLKAGAKAPVSSAKLLSAASPQMSQHSSPQIGPQSLPTSLSNAGTPFKSANSHFTAPSPPTTVVPFSVPREPEKQVSDVSFLLNAGSIRQPPTTAVTQGQALAIGIPGTSAFPLPDEFTKADGNQDGASLSSKASVTETPIERLIKAVKTMSPKALSASVSDIGSVVSMVERLAGSAPGHGSRASVGEDLVASTKSRMRARNATQDGSSVRKKMRRDISAMPLNAVLSADYTFKHLSGLEASDLELTATPMIKRSRIESNYALLEEIRELNQRLIHTVVEVDDEDVDPTAAAEDGEGLIVKCSVDAASLCPNFKTQNALEHMSPILPLRLLVPTNYPKCSPILLDKYPAEVSEYEDLSAKVWLKFSSSLRSLSQVMSLGAMVKTWDVCARAVVADFAEKTGGGTFSSRYGTWENCASAA